MIMHFCDKTWSVCCTNQNQIAVGYDLDLAFLLINIQQEDGIQVGYDPEFELSGKIIQWNFDHGKENLVWVSGEFEL